MSRKSVLCCDRCSQPVQLANASFPGMGEKHATLKVHYPTPRHEDPAEFDLCVPCFRLFLDLLPKAAAP